MEKEFVPYEQALALKELGFDEPCFGYYTSPNKLLIEQPIGKNGDFVYFAPTFSQAFSYLLNHEMVIDKGYQLVEESRGNWGLHQEKENHFELILSSVPKIECLKKLIELCKNN